MRKKNISLIAVIVLLAVGGGFIVLGGDRPPTANSQGEKRILGVLDQMCPCCRHSADARGDGTATAPSPTFRASNATAAGGA